MVSIRLKEAYVIMSMGASRLQFLRNGCELLEKKNNHILKRVRFYKYLFRPICPGKEYCMLNSEMCSVRRNPRLYYLAL